MKSKDKDPWSTTFLRLRASEKKTIERLAEKDLRSVATYIRKLVVEHLEGVTNGNAVTNSTRS